jgi:hypothetical protein
MLYCPAVTRNFIPSKKILNPDPTNNVIKKTSILVLVVNRITIKMLKIMALNKSDQTLHDNSGSPNVREFDIAEWSRNKINKKIMGLLIFLLKGSSLSKNIPMKVAMAKMYVNLISEENPQSMFLGTAIIVHDQPQRPKKGFFKARITNPENRTRKNKSFIFSLSLFLFYPFYYLIPLDKLQSPYLTKI